MKHSLRLVVPNETYYSGQVVSGQLELEVNTKSLNFRSVKLVFFGNEDGIYSFLIFFMTFICLFIYLYLLIYLGYFIM